MCVPTVLETLQTYRAAKNHVNLFNPTEFPPVFHIWKPARETLSRQDRGCARRYGLPLSRETATQFRRARQSGRQKIEKRTFGGPCLEGTLQKPAFPAEGVSESHPVAGIIKGDTPYKTLDAGQATRVATKMPG